jgi:hypothetical protein
MLERSYLARFELKAAEALRSAEMKDLERLEAKYRMPKKAECTAEEPAEPPPAPADSAADPSAAPVQFSLF